MAVNASFISRSIESVTYVKGLIITVYYTFFVFWGDNNKSPHLMMVFPDSKRKLVQIFFSVRHSYGFTLHRLIPTFLIFFYDEATSYFLYANTHYKLTLVI